MDFREEKTVNVLEQLNKGELSILKEMGAHKLRNEMKLLGNMMDLLIKFICIPKDDKKVRPRAISVLRPLFPSDLINPFPDNEDSIVLGFNHPSLGEIFRLVYLCFEKYPNREFFFPVNLPWYECLVPTLNNLKRMGIRIVPMITPSTEKKLDKLFNGDEEKSIQTKHLKNMLERNYMRSASQCVADKTLIFVAPSTTRQEKVIGNHIHPTMTLLAHIIFRRTNSSTIFLPVAIVKPSHSTRAINIFRNYIICPAEEFKASDVITLSTKSRGFDLAFLQRIDEKYRIYSNRNV